MVLFNYTSKELTAKIVYYGPGLCGKTTNLQFIYDGLPTHVRKGKMLSLATKTDRTLFFDFLPIDLGRIRGMKTRVQLYTVPGQVFYNSTRKLVLKGADGVVFVADSQQKMMESNVESYKNLEDNLLEIGLRLEEMPVVMQFNKRDLPHLASVEEMNTLINRHNAPFYEAVATTGIGVEDTLKAITKLVLNHLAAKYSLGAPAEARSAPAPEAETPAAPPREVPADASLRGAAGVGVAADVGDMEIERSSGTGAYHGGPGIPLSGRDEDTPARDDGAAGAWSLAGEQSGEGEAARRSAGPGQDRTGTGEAPDDLEIVDLGEVEGPESLSAAAGERGDPGSQGPMEDLSDLLEEIPAEPGDRSFPSVDEPIPGFEPRVGSAPPAPARPAAASPQPGPLRLVQDRLAPVPTVPASIPVSGESAISPLDPLGIGGARDSEAPVARAIQVGAVTPGQEHQVTVPLEMSVEGRKIRLNLRMTLTISR